MIQGKNKAVNIVDKKVSFNEPPTIVPQQNSSLPDKGQFENAAQRRITTRKRWPYALIGLAAVLSLIWGLTLVWLVISLTRIVVL